MYVCTHEYNCPQRVSGVRIPGAGVTGSCEPAELWSSAKAASVLNPWASSPAPCLVLKDALGPEVWQPDLTFPSGSHLQPPFPVFSWPVPIFLKLLHLLSGITHFISTVLFISDIYMASQIFILLSEQAMFAKQANAPHPLNPRGGR